MLKSGGAAHKRNIVSAPVRCFESVFERAELLSVENRIPEFEGGRTW